MKFEVWRVKHTDVSFLRDPFCVPSRAEQQGFYIEKKCALGPCNLRDEKQSQGLGLDTCDRSKDSYSCFECCKGDGCNTNSAPSLRPALALFGLASVTLILVVTKARRA